MFERDLVPVLNQRCALAADGKAGSVQSSEMCLGGSSGTEEMDSPWPYPTALALQKKVATPRLSYEVYPWAMVFSPGVLGGMLAWLGQTYAEELSLQFSY